MRTTAIALSLSLLSAGVVFASTAPVESSTSARGEPATLAQYGGGVRIWASNDRDYFRRGDRLRVNFSTRANSYVAVVHVDPDGYLDFVYPRSPWDSEFVRAGRTYSLDGTGWSNGLTLRGRGGVGYLYVIASPVPLDYSNFRGGSGSSWDWSYAGRSVSGDPFWAMEQITRMLVPRWNNAPYAVDYYTYFLDGPQRYPSYACASRGFNDGWGWGYSSAWSSYYGSCDRLDLFLRNNPYYFNTRHYRGDRRAYYRDYRDWDPRHGYKADPERSQTRAGSRVQTPGGTQARTPVEAPQRSATPARRPVQEATPSRAPARQPATRAVTPRAAERQPAASAPAPRAREAPQRKPAASAPAPAPRTRTAAPRPAERERTQSARPQPAPSTTRTAAPSERSSSSSGSSSSTPRSRRGGD